MLSKNSNEITRNQMQMINIENLVPQDHLLRLIDEAIDWSFIYELVEEKYSPDQGRPSMDPVMLIKIPFIQYLYGIPSMRRTTEEINVNVAYKWFLGLSLTDPAPHFSTFGKNYTRRFKGTDLFEQIFAHILEECMEMGFVDENEVFIDSTHVKAHANSHKSHREKIKEEALFYEKTLEKEIQSDRDERRKKRLQKKEKNEEKEVKKSDTDPESGWFHKGEHKSVFAYSIQTACDRHGWILSYDVNPGNLHDSRTFHGIYEKLERFDISMMVMDAGYKTPAIAKMIMDDGHIPLFPYTSPKNKKGYFYKKAYEYDAEKDCYICPDGEELKYSTTNRKGYREYKSNRKKCKNCPFLDRCTGSMDHQKLVTRHIWQDYLDECEIIRLSEGMGDVYRKRKETIERLFGTAKEHHGLRYTNMNGTACMEIKVGLTFSCMNLKKLAKMKKRLGLIGGGPDNNGLIFLLSG